ncbi:DUF4369 domain-containing protein [Aquimarina agarilytica]|uniref:DUF4369 domain-containing protein n=1 Tax=Aquimarina agarilytica TaxID=1087449 RepID=UPI00058F0D6D|nr:DUF4369 domain-containing protein [Aquimarina agarilytica]
MKKLYYLFIFLGLISLCTNCSNKDNTFFKGTIKGLSKGTIYLQQIQDTLLVTIDSVQVNGVSDFEFSLNLKEPDIFYLYLDKNDGTIYDDRLEVFLEPGEITFSTKLYDFERLSKVVGSENHEKFMSYKKTMQQFNLKNINLLQQNFDAHKQNDTNLIKEVETKLNTLLKTKYLYTVNFAIQNKKYEVAPYITLREISDANVTFLDTVHNSLSLKIKKSKYGKQLKALIKEQKKTTNNKNN